MEGVTGFPDSSWKTLSENQISFTSVEVNNENSYFIIVNTKSGIEMGFFLIFFLSIVVSVPVLKPQYPPYLEFIEGENSLFLESDQVLTFQLKVDDSGYRILTRNTELADVVTGDSDKAIMEYTGLRSSDYINDAVMDQFGNWYIVGSIEKIECLGDLIDEGDPDSRRERMDTYENKWKFLLVIPPAHLVDRELVFDSEKQPAHQVYRKIEDFKGEVFNIDIYCAKENIRSLYRTMKVSGERKLVYSPPICEIIVSGKFTLTTTEGEVFHNVAWFSPLTYDWYGLKDKDGHYDYWRFVVSTKGVLIGLRVNKDGSSEYGYHFLERNFEVDTDTNSASVVYEVGAFNSILFFVKNDVLVRTRIFEGEKETLGFEISSAIGGSLTLESQIRNNCSRAICVMLDNKVMPTNEILNFTEPLFDFDMFFQEGGETTTLALGTHSMFYNYNKKTIKLAEWDIPIFNRICTANAHSLAFVKGERKPINAYFLEICEGMCKEGDTVGRIMMNTRNSTYRDCDCGEDKITHFAACGFQGVVDFINSPNRNFLSSSDFAIQTPHKSPNNYDYRYKCEFNEDLIVNPINESYPSLKTAKSFFCSIPQKKLEKVETKVVNGTEVNVTVVTYEPVISGVNLLSAKFHSVSKRGYGTVTYLFRNYQDDEEFIDALLHHNEPEIGGGLTTIISCCGVAVLFLFLVFFFTLPCPRSKWLEKIRQNFFRKIYFKLFPEEEDSELLRNVLFEAKLKKIDEEEQEFNELMRIQREEEQKKRRREQKEKKKMMENEEVKMEENKEIESVEYQKQPDIREEEEEGSSKSEKNEECGTDEVISSSEEEEEEGGYEKPSSSSSSSSKEEQMTDFEESSKPEEIFHSTKEEEPEITYNTQIERTDFSVDVESDVIDHSSEQQLLDPKTETNSTKSSFSDLNLKKEDLEILDTGLKSLGFLDFDLRRKAVEQERDKSETESTTSLGIFVTLVLLLFYIVAVSYTVENILVDYKVGLLYAEDKSRTIREEEKEILLYVHLNDSIDAIKFQKIAYPKNIEVNYFTIPSDFEDPVVFLSPTFQEGTGKLESLGSYETIVYGYKDPSFAFELPHGFSFQSAYWILLHFQWSQIEEVSETLTDNILEYLLTLFPSVDLEHDLPKVTLALKKVSVIEKRLPGTFSTRKFSVTVDGEVGVKRYTRIPFALLVISVITLLGSVLALRFPVTRCIQRLNFWIKPVFPYIAETVAIGACLLIGFAQLYINIEVFSSIFLWHLPLFGIKFAGLVLLGMTVWQTGWCGSCANIDPSCIWCWDCVIEPWYHLCRYSVCSCGLFNCCFCPIWCCNCLILFTTSIVPFMLLTVFLADVLDTSGTQDGNVSTRDFIWDVKSTSDVVSYTFTGVDFLCVLCLLVLVVCWKCTCMKCWVKGKKKKGKEKFKYRDYLGKRKKKKERKEKIVFQKSVEKEMEDKSTSDESASTGSEDDGEEATDHEFLDENYVKVENDFTTQEEASDLEEVKNEEEVQQIGETKVEEEEVSQEVGFLNVDAPVGLQRSRTDDLYSDSDE